MDLELTDDQLHLRDNARSVLASACPTSLVRSVHEGTGGGDALWKQLTELDWPALGIPEAAGGIGLSFVDVGVVVEELGRAVAPTPFLATVTQFAAVVAEAGAPEQHEHLLGPVATGSRTGTLALAADGVWDERAPGVEARRADGGWRLRGTATHVLDGATADEVAVVAGGDGGIGVFVVAGDAASVRTRHVIDPTMPVADLTFDDVAVEPDRVLLEPGDPAAPEAVARALQVATTAMAASTVATCRAIFERTLDYAKDREQFGRPIGSFQAVKHRLADLYLAVERANALTWFAALTIAEDDERRRVATHVAKAAAGDCQRLLARDGLQLHGGIGYTWENDLHFFLKRAKTGDALLGTAAFHRARLATILGLAS